MKISSTGTGSFDTLESWQLGEYATPVVAGETGASIGDMTLGVTRTPDTDLLVEDTLTVEHPTLGTGSYKVARVSMTGPHTASVAADSQLERFLSGRVSIPGVESGLPAAAADMLMQLTGDIRQTGPNAADDYWSLAGHSVGFHADGSQIEPIATLRTMSNTGVNITTGALKPEQVLYQEVAGLCAIDDFAAGGYPRKVLGSTLQIARDLTYLKFTVRPTTVDTTTTWDVSFGPSTRFFPGVGFGLYTNVTRMTLTLSTTATGGTLAGLVRHQGAITPPTDATDGTGSAIAALARGQEITVSLRAFAGWGFIGLKFHAESAAGETSEFEIMEEIPGAASRLYSKHWTITQDAGGAGVKDLVQRTAGIEVDEWGSFIGRSYANPTALVNELTSEHGGSPIAAFDGEMWDYLKQIAAARGVEIAVTSSGITLREPRIRELDISQRGSASRTISSAVTARNVTLVNQNTATLATTSSEAFRATSIYSVDVGETTIFTVAIPDGIRFLWSPTPWFNSAAANAVQVLSTADQYAALEAGLVGKYYVTAADGYPVNPSQWTNYGGRLTAAIVDGSAQITLTGPTQEIPGVSGPFKIGESAISEDYAVLRIMGVGVSSNPVEVKLPSGGAHSRTRVESSSTVTNVAIGSLGELYDAAAWVAQRTAGPTVTLSAAVPLKLAGAIGYLTGALVTFEGNIFRVDSARVSSGVATLDATKMTSLGDTPNADRTLDEFLADLDGVSCSDYSIRPLKY